VVRLAWVPLATYVPRWLDPALRARDPVPRPAILFVVSWTSMRGMVSLAAALALPFATAAGAPTPFRAEIVLITVMVILVTLVLQGMTLIPIIARLHLTRDQSAEIEEGHARAESRRAALEALADLVDEPWATAEARASVEAEIRHSHAHHGSASEEAVKRADAIRRIRLALVRAKRRALIRLRDEQAISDEVLLDLESELDYEALRLGAGRDR
jgi:CPA1 family monovalent cation:H+ antiporter